MRCPRCGGSGKQGFAAPAGGTDNPNFTESPETTANNTIGFTRMVSWVLVPVLIFAYLTGWFGDLLFDSVIPNTQPMWYVLSSVALMLIAPFLLRKHIGMAGVALVALTLYLYPGFWKTQLKEIQVQQAAWDAAEPDRIDQRFCERNRESVTKLMRDKPDDTHSIRCRPYIDL